VGDFDPKDGPPGEVRSTIIWTGDLLRWLRDPHDERELHEVLETQHLHAPIPNPFEKDEP
jgi:hypothetical protein